MKKILYLVCFIIFSESTFAQQLQLLSSNGYAQGTTFSIKYYDSQNRNFDNEFKKILDDFNVVFSGYDDSSIVSSINRNEKNIVVDSMFSECFNRSMEISKQSDGDFDITVFPLVNAWGFGPKQKLSLDKKKVDSLLTCIGYKKVTLVNHSIVKKDPRICLDFGAIAQGYSTDIISRFLLKQGITNFIVEIGGEVYANGIDANGDFWKVSIEMPIDNSSDSLNLTIASIKISNQAVSTSGNYRKFYIVDGKKYSHEIDPHTGYPARNNVLSATIVARNCASADAYATASMVMGLEKSIAFFKIHPELEALLYYSKPDGSIGMYQTKGMSALIIPTIKK